MYEGSKTKEGLINSFYHITNTDSNKFTDDCIARITSIQNNNETVEVQYQTSILSGEVVIYSALIVGRINSTSDNKYLQKTFFYATSE